VKHTNRKPACSPLLAAAVALAFAAPAATLAAGSAPTHPTMQTMGPRGERAYDQFIVKFRDGTPEHGSAAARQRVLDGVAHRTGLRIDQVRRMAVGADVVRSDRHLGREEAKSLLVALKRDPRVEYAEIDLPVYPAMVPNDPLYNGNQWHYYEGTAGIDAQLAWDVTSGSGQYVAVLDTGITSHPDLNANIVAGYDFITSATTANDGTGRDTDPSDPGDWVALDECPGGNSARNSSWHGTHVAGTIAAVTNNGVGVAGVAFNAKVQPLRVLGKCGGISSDIGDAIVWASGGTVSGLGANPTVAKVINLSLGGPGSCGSATQASINTAVANGSTVVIAAGNSNIDTAGFQPANCANVIAVGAVGRTGERASYSNYGTTVDITAPGGDGADGIASTLNDGTMGPGAAIYSFLQGTSMATPHVAGVAALVRSAGGTGFTPSGMETLLKATSRAQPVDCPEGCGAGLLDAYVAVYAATTPVLDIQDPIAVDEGDAGAKTLTFTVRLTQALGTAVTYDIATSNGSATAGSDYVAKALVGETIPAGQTSRTFTVTVNGDTTAEGDETFFVNLTNVVAAGVTIDDTQGTGRIRNDDPVSLANGVPVTNQAGATGSLTRYLLAVPAGATNLAFATTGGTGDADLFVSFNADPTTLAHDCASETGTNNETCNIASAQAGSYHVLVYGFSEYTGLTLTGSYTAPITTNLSIGDVSTAEGNSGTRTVTFTVQLSEASPSPVTYNITTANNTAVSGSDYVANALVGETIPAGQLSKTFTVTVNGDTGVEANEWFNVNVSAVTNANLVDGQALGIVLNDDGPTLSIADVVYAEGASGTRTMVFTAKLSQVAAVPVTFNIATANGTATAGSDYVASSLTGQSIAAGQLTRTFLVTINGDATVEQNETLLVNLSGASGASILDAQAIGTIVNDDGPTLSIADVLIAEGNSGTKVMTLTVKLSQAAGVPVTYSIATQNNTASAGSDYVAKGLVGETIPAGQLSKTFTVTVNGDSTLEANEWFNVNLTSPTNATIYDGQGLGIIVNDEGPLLSIGDVQLGEGNSGTQTMTFTVTLSQAAAGTVTFTAATANDTAFAGTDYVAKSLAGQSIAAGMLSKTFTVTVNGDTAVEPNEWFKVKLSAATGATIYDGEALGILLNDEGANLRVNDVAVSEGLSGTKTLTFTVSTPTAAAGTITYNISTSNTTATAGSDYVAKSLVGETIAAGMLSKTFGVVINGDGTIEPSETFKVTITSASGATIYDQVGVGTITNDD
jgi:serine protease